MSKEFSKDIILGMRTVRSLPYNELDVFSYPIVMGETRVPSHNLWAYYFLQVTKDLFKILKYLKIHHLWHKFGGAN